MEAKHVVVYPSGGDGCGMYRMRWPGEALAAKGHPVTVMPRMPQITIDSSTKPPTVMDINTGSADVVVFQRPASYQHPAVISHLQKKGIKVIIDMDDSLSTIHPQNPAFKQYSPHWSPQMNYEFAQQSCDMADLVTVTTPALAEEYGKHGRVQIIPNHIPERYLGICRPAGKGTMPTVGWAGWVKTHPGDLNVTHGVINQALVETGANFCVIGDNEMMRQLAIRNRAGHFSRGFVNIMQYPKELAWLDIGLVPLADTYFNSCKSWLKGLEYASVGVVPVMSPSPDNLRLAELGIGLIARTPAEWKEHVTTLILDIEYREQMAAKGREIASDWTIEGNTAKWAEAWDIV